MGKNKSRSAKYLKMPIFIDLQTSYMAERESDLPRWCQTSIDNSTNLKTALLLITLLVVAHTHYSAYNECLGKSLGKNLGNNIIWVNLSVVLMFSLGKN